MTVDKIADILGGEVLCCKERAAEMDIRSAFASDMMSDVLAYVNDQGLLLTGLVNPQVIRTAEMMDIRCVAFVRGKRPDEKVIEFAAEKGIILIATEERLYPACGKLYNAGLCEGSGNE